MPADQPPQPDDPHFRTYWVDEFAKAWGAGPPPNLDDYLGNLPPGDPRRRPLLEELVVQDLHCRWEKRLAQPPRLENYLDCFPELDTPEAPLPLALIAEEYDARYQYDPAGLPTMDEYLRRFPRHDAAALRQALAANLPDQIGPYLVRRLLGQGGMGVVYLAHDPGLNRPVALKMLRTHRFATEEEHWRFRFEAEMTARLRHPHIAQVFEVGTYKGLPFFALEYVGGGTLSDRLLKQPLPSREAAALLALLARAVQAAHSQGVLHRDLKPANILLEPDGTPKVTDFGLARRLAEADGASGPTRSGAILGTPSYMAPEQARGDTRAIGPAADTYALGAILYECLTGRPPFQAATAYDTVLQVIEKEPLPPSQVQATTPRDLETICLKCLAKDPTRRYPSPQALADDLQRYLDGDPIRARPVGWGERVWKWVRKHKAAATALALAVLMLLAVGIGGLVVAGQQAEIAQKAGENERLEKARADEAVAAQHREAALRRAAFQAVLDLLRGVADQPAFKRAELLETARALVRRAEDYVEQLARQGPATPQMLLEVGRTQLAVADLHRELGDAQKAEAAITKAQAGFRTLLQTAPQDLVLRRLLAGTHFNLGLMFADQGRSEEALAALQQAEGDFRALAGLTADSDFHWDWGMAASRLAFALWQRATARKGHGRTQEAAADWAQARKYGEQAVQILDKVCAGDATSDGYRLAQAQARSHLGGLLLDGPRPADCLPYLESGLALTLALSRTAPARTDYAVQAAGLEVNLGTFKVYSGGAAEHQEEGLRLGDSALKRLQPILKTVPHHRTANEFFLKAHLLLAEGLEKRKRFGDAVAHWDTFLARIPVGPLVPFWRAKRAYCRARAGEAAAALDDARQLATPPTMVREGQLAGATWTYLALVAALAAGPDPSPEVAQLALTRVEEARVVGYFQTPARVDELKRDPDWEPVRRLPGFGAFLQRFTSDQGNPEPAKAHP